MNSQSLLDATYRLVESSDLSYPEIAAGASVKTDWFASFMQRRIREPGVNKVQRVHDFLASRSGQQQPAALADPKPSQSLGESGGG